MLDHMICMICFVLHICDNMQKLMVTVFFGEDRSSAGLGVLCLEPMLHVRDYFYVFTICTFN